MEMIFGGDDGTHPMAFAVIAISVVIMMISGCTDCGPIGLCGG